MTAVYGLAAALGVLRAAHTVVLVLFAAAAFLAAVFAEYVLWIAAVDTYRWLRARKYRRMRREIDGGKR